MKIRNGKHSNVFWLSSKDLFFIHIYTHRLTSTAITTPWTSSMLMQIFVTEWKCKWINDCTAANCKSFQAMWFHLGVTRWSSISAPKPSLQNLLSLSAAQSNKKEVTNNESKWCVSQQKPIVPFPSVLGFPYHGWYRHQWHQHTNLHVQRNPQCCCCCSALECGMEFLLPCQMAHS